MTCPSELSLAVHADGELTARDLMEMEQHVAECDRCRMRVVMLREESRIVAAALAYDPVAVAVPAFQRPVTVGALLVGAAATMLVAIMLSALQRLIGALLPEMLTWFDPVDAGGITNLVVRAGVFFIERGEAMVTSIAQTAAVTVVLLLLVWIVVALRGRIRGPFVVAALLLGMVSIHPAPSEAVEIRYNEKGAVFLAADETVDDTLIAVGDTVEVNGNVDGDLLAFGRRVVIRGKVAGLVITGGESVALEGAVDGSVFAGAEALDVSSSRIGRNLFGGGQTVTVSETTNIEQNALVGGEKVSLAGRIGRDVLGGAEDLVVASTIGRTLTAFTNRMTLLAPARITGDVHAHGLEKKDHVIVSPGAVIGGELVTELEKHEDANRYQTGSFYLSQLLWLAAAFVTGFVLLVVVPGLRRVSIHDAGDAFRVGAHGIVALVATPIIAVLVCLTLIGIPLGLIALLAWGAAIYLAKVVVAQLIGTHFIEAMAQRREHFAVGLAFGLLVVTLVTNLPFIGGIVAFLLTILGLGLLVLFVRDELRPAAVEES